MPKRLPQKIAKCLFCGGAPTNWEHVWPRWSHRYIKKSRKKWTSLHAVEYEDHTEFEFKKHAGDPHDWQVKCVDERCNNGWMRDLENAVRPILIPLIKGDEGTVFIRPKQQRLIAAWIALKVIVQEFAPLGDRVSHYTQIRRLWKTQTPPDNTWRIWLARFNGPDASSLWHSFPMLIIPDAVAARRRTRRATYYNSQAATYVIGELLIHVVRCPYQRLVREFRFHPGVAAKMARIWPLTGYDPRWPLEPLTDIEAGHLVWALRSFVKGSG